MGRAQITISDPRDKSPGSVDSQRADFAARKLGPVMASLASQAAQQLQPANSGKSRIVVALGDQRRTACPGVDYPYTPSIASEVDRREQARRSATDDQAIDIRLTWLAQEASLLVFICSLTVKRRRLVHTRFHTARVQGIRHPLEDHDLPLHGFLLPQFARAHVCRR